MALGWHRPSSSPLLDRVFAVAALTTVAFGLLVDATWVLETSRLPVGGGGVGWVAGSLATLAVAWAIGRRRATTAGASPPVVVGPPTLVTISRAVVLAWLGGFLVVDLGGRLGVGAIAAGDATAGSHVVWWLPAGLYAVAVSLDAVDGGLARRLDAETELGAALDAEYDGFGLLVAPLVGVAGGALPAAYLLVGFARYAFLAAKWRRRRRGFEVAPLPARRSRRVLAGLQMGFVAVALTPAVGYRLATAGAVVLGGAYLLGFVRDWLYVSGRLAP